MQALAREHGGQLTQAQAAPLLLQGGSPQADGHPAEAAGALWSEMGLQVGTLIDASRSSIADI